MRSAGFEGVGIRDGRTEWTHPVAVAASTEILRGTWHGTVRDYPAEHVDGTLTLDLASSHADARSYAVSGTFGLGDGEPGDRYVAMLRVGVP